MGTVAAQSGHCAATLPTGTSSRPCAIRASWRPADSFRMQASQMAWQQPQETPALCPPSMPRTSSQREAHRPVVFTSAFYKRDAGFANSSNNAVQRRLEQLDVENKEVAAQLKAAWAASIQDPGNQLLQERVKALQDNKASLNERLKALEAKLVGGMAAVGKAAGLAGPLMQAFWDKLRELRATAGSLDVADYMGRKFQVIDLGGALPFPGKAGVTRVLRRDCYQVAHRALEEVWAAPGPKRTVVISGTSGTGKTVFLYDIMFEYALHDHPILWHSEESPNTLYCFGPDGVRKGSWEAFQNELQDPDAIYLCDSVPPFSADAMVWPRTVIAVPPHRLKENFFYDLVKIAAKLWFPVPSDEEMHAAAPLYGVDEALCKELMYRWGNVPRYVLQHAHDEQEQQLLDDAIKSASAKSIEDAMRDYGAGDQLTAKLVHVRATPELARKGVGLGSVWIQLQLYERLRGYEVDAAQRLVEFCTCLGAGLAAGAEGGVHQGVAHRAFKQGGWFLVRNHRGQQSVIRLPPLRVVEVSTSQQMAELASWWEASPTDLRPDGMYALPSDPIFVALDSAVILDPASLAAPPAKAPTSTSNTSGAASSTIGDSFSSALSSTSSTSTRLSGTEPLEATHTDADVAADTASSATLAADALQTTLVLDEPATPAAGSSPAAAASGATLGKALVLGVQITTNRNHGVNYPGWQRFCSATGSHTLAFAVPFSKWSAYPPQKFDGGPADPAQPVPCDQLVITWVPATAGELNNLTMHGLRELGKAYGIGDASTVPRDCLVRRLLKAEVPTADFSILEAALQKATGPVSEPEPAGGAVDLVASTVIGAGLPVVDGQLQRTVSSARQCTKAQLKRWSATELQDQCDQCGVPWKDANGKKLGTKDVQKLFVSMMNIDR